MSSSFVGELDALHSCHQAHGSLNYSGVVHRSAHLHFARTSSDEPLAYHRLFGNIAVIDRELLELLSNESRTYSVSSLITKLGMSQTEELWDNYFLVANTHDERDEIGKWLKEREKQLASGCLISALQITASNACNLACTYCFADSSDRRSSVRRQIDMEDSNIDFRMAAEAIARTLELAREHGREQIVVKFLGREPLVNWRVLRRLFDTFGTREVQWAITTNGTLITDEIADCLRDHGVLTVVSLDGPPPVNDQFRVFKSGKGSYGEVWEGLKRLRNARAPFGISSVLSSATRFTQFRPFIDDLIEVGASELELTLAMQTDLVQIQSALAATRLAAELAGIYNYCRGRIHVHGDWIDPFYRLLSTRKRRVDQSVDRPLGASCSATSHQLSLEPTGDLFPCRAMSSHYGHVSDLRSALATDAYRAVAMRTFYNVDYCRGCVLEGFCQGTCLGSSEEASGDIYNPQEEYCGVYREVTALLLEDWIAEEVIS